jgi:hypothetical protein
VRACDRAYAYDAVELYMYVRGRRAGAGLGLGEEALRSPQG